MDKSSRLARNSVVVALNDSPPCYLDLLIPSARNDALDRGSWHSGMALGMTFVFFFFSSLGGVLAWTDWRVTSVRLVVNRIKKKK